MTLFTILLVLLFLLSGILFVLTIIRVRKQQFFSDVFWFFPFGVYVWGDGLVLFPFWMLIAVIFLVFGLPISMVYRVVLGFFFLRSFFEVIYWLLQQSIKSTYKPPLTRNIPGLTAEAGQILYQVAHTCVLVMIGLLFALTFGMQ
jgi:hypothetical protein